MKRTKLLNLDEYFKYLDFIKECQFKNYDSSLVLHKHHIIPRCLDNEKEFENHTVLVSVEDHINAHVLLSKCFDEGSYERNANLLSARILNKKSIRTIPELDELSETMKGDLNPAKRPEVRNSIKEGLARYYQNNDESKKGKTYEQIYGDTAELEKQKRRKKTRTDAEYKLSAQKASITLKKRTSSPDYVNPNAQRVRVNGTVYNSIAKAAESLNVSSYKLLKYHKVEKL